MLYPQALHVGVTANWINERLGEGFRALFVHPRDDGTWDALLEGRVPEPDVDQAEVVLQFLSSVAPSTIEREMLDHVDLAESPGQSAIRALVKVVQERIRAAA